MGARVEGERGCELGGCGRYVWGRSIGSEGEIAWMRKLLLLLQWDREWLGKEW